MGLILRRSLNRPLTHDELDGNLVYLDINEWALQSYEKGMWVYFKDTDSVTVLYLCETTHNKTIYPSGVFAEVINSVRIWRPFRGGGGSAFFQNADPTTASNLEGIPAGSTFPMQKTMQEMWDLLLYPYQSPAFTSFYFIGHNGTLEVGDSFTGDTASWTTSHSANVVPNSVQISGWNLTTVTGLTANGTAPLIFNAPVTSLVKGSKNWLISGVNTHSIGFNRSLYLYWDWLTYWGTSSSTGLTGSQVTGLTNHDLLSDFPGNYAFPTGGYKYICIPDAYCSGTHYPAYFWDLSLGLQVAMYDHYSNFDNTNSTYDLVSVTNVHGITTDYRIYRTKWEVGAITIIVT